MGAAGSTSWLESLSTRAGADGAARTIRSRRMRRMVSRPMTCQLASGPITPARTMRGWFTAPVGGADGSVLCHGRAVCEDRAAFAHRHARRGGRRRPADDQRHRSRIEVRRTLGGRWADAPRDVCGPKRTHCNRFVRWRAKGIRADLFETLAQAGGPPFQVLVDSTAVKAHRCAAGGKGGSKVRLSVARGEGARPRSTRSPTAPDARSPFY